MAAEAKTRGAVVAACCAWCWDDELQRRRRASRPALGGGGIHFQYCWNGVCLPECVKQAAGCGGEWRCGEEGQRGHWRGRGEGVSCCVPRGEGFAMGW
jgi:hypothetical protein